LGHVFFGAFFIPTFLFQRADAGSLPQDVFWALYFGRDFGGPSMDRRVTPMPHVDTELDQLPWHYAPANIPPQPNYYSLVFSESSKLFAIARQIIQIVCVLVLHVSSPKF
jgi:hypothetical protein